MAVVIAWTEMEDAVFDWVVAGSQLDEDHVLWSKQTNGPFPDGPYVAMRWTAGPRSLGQDWTKTTKEVDASGDDIITIHIQGPRVMTLTLRCYNAEEIGDGSGVSILGRILMAHRLPSVQAILRAGHVGVGPAGTPQAIDAMRGMLFDPFAIVTVDLNLAADISEPGYVIEHVEFTLNDDPPVWIPDPPDVES